MGYYIETGANNGKADHIIREHGAKEVNDLEAFVAAKHGEGVVVVVDNGGFEAAAFAYDPEEFARFSDIMDPRPRRFLVLPYEKAAALSGYKK